MIRILRVSGLSMVPTLHDRDIVLALKKHHRVGDVVVAVLAGKLVVKRIYSIVSGRIELRGDNDLDSIDSREYGYVRAEHIKGVVVWPRMKRHKFKHEISE